MIAEAVHQLLRTSPAIGGATGAPTIDYAERPQGEPLPGLVITREPVTRSDHAKGAADVQRGAVGVVCMAATYLAAQELADRVTAALNGFSGSVVIEAGEVRLHLINPTTSDVPSDHRDGEGQIRTHGVRVSFRFVLHEPPAAS